ncbi:MAG: hypothetical protein K5896_13170 [Prevotella sp.]|nr:hypothetical protein [Prevotella sp.]
MGTQTQTPTEFILKARSNIRDGYYEIEVVSDGKCLSREKGNQANNEWADMIKNDPANAHNYVRFVQLKPNAAHIIYYRGEGIENSQYRANWTTTRHYLTYSNTDDNSSVVSSRRSVIPSDKSLWTLPTAAAYHQDGLWALEEAGSNGEFYIKKYGTEEYLKQSDDHISILGTKDGANGKYRVENPTVNRYSPIQNLKFEETTLTSDMFYEWDGYGANASSTGSANLSLNYGTQEAPLGGGALVAGTGEVNYLKYANLGNNTKMVIKGTPGIPLRVLMSRQQSNSGPLVEKAFSIGSDGKAIVDLTNLELNHATGNATVRMTYVSGSDGSSYEPSNGDPYTIPDNRNTSFGEIQYGDPAYCGYNRISSNGTVILGNIAWNVNNLTYLQVDVSALLGTKGTIRKVTLKGDFQQISDREMIYGVGYNNSEWSSTMTWNTADRSITTLGATQTVSKANDDVELSFDITDAFTSGKVKTILVYNLAAGAGYIKNPRVTVEYSPNEPVSYAHLNAIKTGYGGASGTISSITLVNENSEASSGSRYLHYDTGDGAPVKQWTTKYGDVWNAGFYPVEVPVPNKDNFFQVLVELKAGKGNIPIELSGTNADVTITNPRYVDGKLYGGTFTPSGAQKNIFQIQPLSTGTHTHIVIKFGSAVPATGQWRLFAYGNLIDITGLTEYTLNLNGDIPDFTIFNLDSGADPITINECYFVQKREMINYSGTTSDYSEAEDERILWQLEQVDDYTEFRLKNPNTGEYLKPQGQGVTAPNDPNDAEVYTNQKFFTDFALKWFLPKVVVDKEIRVEYYVRHRESYLRTYADDQVITDQKGLKKQGLSYDVDSEWKNFDGNLDGFTQKVNHFEITHYVKKGDSRVIEFPTVLNRNNDHIFYQRFFNYDEVDTSMDLSKLKDHVSLDTRDDGDVQYFLYNNGMVTGQKLNWTTYDNDIYKDIPDGGMARNEQRRFNFTNSDGQRFTVGVDVARYSDLEYLNSPDHLAGDLREPSLTMRYLFYMRDAKEMAASLTACPEGSDNWLESKEFHFGRTQVPYTKFKKVGYRGEFLPIRHIFSDYWVYDNPQLIDENYLSSLGLTGEALNDYLDQHLVSAVNDDRSGKIEVEVIPGNTGIRKGGYNPNINLNSEEAGDGNDADYQGFYMYDLLSPSPKYDYGNSRFTVFRYPSIGYVENYGPENPAYVNVYLNAGGQRYQIAHYTIIFDANMATRPWTEIKNGTSYANGINYVKGTNRDPKQLRAKAGLPIAKVTFDFPQKMKISGVEENATYHYPSTSDCPSTDGVTRHNGGNRAANGTIPNSSPVPLTFDHTNYAFDGDDCNWGSYAIVTQKSTAWGNQKTVLPADDAEHGYNLNADPGMNKAFMYIDASEQPGDICAIEFEGEFCANDQLMCTGWISGSNKIQGDTRCPGSITLTVKGEDASGKTKTIYRFCPSQIYELDNGYEMPGATQTNVSGTVGNAGIDGNENGATHVVWQQFYFEFSTDQKYERYWLEVNNNCVSSNGGDFMLDNIEVYTIVPEVIPDINTPLCVQKDGVADMRLLKLNVDYNKLLSSVIKQESTSSTTTQNPYLGLVFLDKVKFLTTLRQELDETSLSLDEMAIRVETGYYDNELDGSDTRYQNAFNAALLRNNNSTAIWKSDTPNANMGAGVMYFQWSKTYANDEKQPVYTFAKAVNKTSPVYRAKEDGVDYLILNGNYPQLPWKPNTEYYIVPSNTYIESFNLVYDAFNICSNCSKASVFEIQPPYTILSMESSDITQELEVCEGKIPTLLTDLKGYTYNGQLVPLKDLNFDWWLGDLSADPKVLATLENYHSQKNAAGTVRLDEALYNFRAHYPGITTLDGVTEQLREAPYLTRDMIYYLQELVAKGQLILHQKSISIPAERVAPDDPYFYLVACPIHDGYFDQALNHEGANDVAYFCDEPQGLRMKVGEKAPSLKCGFVPNENGYTSYAYPAGNPVLSIRLAKRAQFETVQHGTVNEEPLEWENNSDVNFLWLPIRDALVQSDGSTKVIQKSDDYNIYLASTDDPTWDKKIYTAMNTNGNLPIVGKIVKLNAIDKDKNSGMTEKDENRLCIYFIKYLTSEQDENQVFDVREGYNYTLSLPFRESPGENTCDGTLLIHLKIVPDYEVWTGGAGSTDWNNDQNWRRADGNMTMPSQEAVNESKLNNNELLVSNDLTESSGLYQYTTNYTNYRTAKDRLLRKGYAPLYCTHILLKSNEWGDAPVLYDALKGKDALDDYPFPNLSEAVKVNSVQYVVDERFESIEALSGKSFAIVNESEGKALFGTTAQNLGYNNYYAATQNTNSGYYFVLESVAEGYLFRLQNPGGGNYEFDAWGRHWDGYLNSQPYTGTVSFILGLEGWDHNYTYGQDGNNLALWQIVPDGSGKFALRNVGTGRYLKDATSAKYDDPTYFTFCTLKEETVTTSQLTSNILKFDMQAREYSIWNETYGSNPDKGRDGDLIAEMYQINSCDEIALQPTAEMRNAHLLNYNNAWMEYQLDMNRWYLLGSALQGTISGEWYAPTGNAQQKTTYYENVTFGEGYDRYSPAIYQRSWDKAKAILYEVGAEYSTSDNPDDLALNNGSMPGSVEQGTWSGTTWNTTGADDYLDRLGYKPLGDKKVNVAIKGVWSNTYNDATVDYSKGAFSVMVKNDLKGNSNANPAIVRLPKEDTMYDYYRFEETGAADGGTDTDLSDIQDSEGLNRALNRGRLKTDNLLPTSNTSLPLYQKIQRTEASASRYGDQRTYTRVPTQMGENALPMTLKSFSEKVSAGASSLGYFLVENPFPCGMNMDAFFAGNPGLQKKYWLLTADGQHLVQYADGQWVEPNGTTFNADEAVVAPGQGFFVQAIAAGQTVTATWNFTNNSAMATEAEGLSNSTASKSLKSVEDNGILLTIEPNGAKIRDNNNSVNMQNGVVLKVPVVSTNDVVTVTGFSGYSHYTVGGSANTNPVTTYTATSANVEQGYVEITSTDNNNYFVSIVVEQDQIAATTANKSTKIFFTADMQAQTRFGKKSNEGTTFEIVVGTKQKMETKTVSVDDDDDPNTPDIELKVEVPVTDNDGNYVLEDVTEEITIYKYVQDTGEGKEFPLQSRRTRATDAEEDGSLGLVITAQRGTDESSALVLLRDEASDDFLPEEDTEVFINSDLKNVPTVYTLCGRLATTINSIHDFRYLPLGVESASDAPCVLTFNGVELLGDSIAFYDAVKQELTPLKSGMQFTVSGQTQNRYYLVKTLIQEEAAVETHLQIFTRGDEVTVIASTEEPLTSVRCYDTAGRLVYSASPKTAEHRFNIAAKGIFIIEAQTKNDRKTKKVSVSQSVL